MILLAAISSDQALQVFEGIEGDRIGEVAEQQARLIRIRSGEMTDWKNSALGRGEDALSVAIRVAAWRESEHCGEDLPADELLRGSKILTDIGECLPNPICWQLAGKLISEARYAEAVVIIEEVEIESPEHVVIALNLLSSRDSDSISVIVRSSGILFNLILSQFPILFHDSLKHK